MLLRELKYTAIHHGEDAKAVSGAINPLVRSFAKRRGNLRTTSDYVRATNEGEATVEWYLENIQSLTDYELERADLHNFGPRRRAYLDILIERYYKPDPYERPLGYDY